MGVEVPQIRFIVGVAQPETQRQRIVQRIVAVEIGGVAGLLLLEGIGGVATECRKVAEAEAKAAEKRIGGGAGGAGRQTERDGERIEAVNGVNDAVDVQVEIDE